MYFLELDKRLRQYSDFFNDCDEECTGLGMFNAYFEPGTISEDLLQASWFVQNMFTLACKDWSIDEEEFLKESLFKGGHREVHIEDTIRYVASILNKPHMFIHMKAISFGYTSKFYDIPEHLWRRNENDN